MCRQMEVNTNHLNAIEGGKHQGCGLHCHEEEGKRIRRQRCQGHELRHHQSSIERRPPLIHQRGGRDRHWATAVSLPTHHLIGTRLFRAGLSIFGLIVQRHRPATQMPGRGECLHHLFQPRRIYSGERVKRRRHHRLDKLWEAGPGAAVAVPCLCICELMQAAMA